MKSRILLIIAAVALFAAPTYAQKIKIKKNIISIDGDEVYSVKEKEDSKVISHLYGEEFVLITEVAFSIPNPLLETSKRPEKVTPKVVKQEYIDVTFLYLDLEFETELSYEHLLMVMNDCKIHDTQGNMNRENAFKLASSISKKISGNKPAIAYSR